MKKLKRTAGGSKPGDGVGASNANAKLTDDELLEIYTKVKEGLPYGGLKKYAAECGLSYPLLQKIAGGTYPRLNSLLEAKKT